MTTTRLICIIGAESSGKTTLALHAMAEVQKRGGNVALIDAEHAFDPVFAKVRRGWMAVGEVAGVDGWMGDVLERPWGSVGWAGSRERHLR